MDWLDMVSCAIGTAGLAQLWTRVDGGPGAWARERIAPALEAMGLGELARCAFCASAWIGGAMALTAITCPPVAHAIAAAVAGPALLWLAGEAPRRVARDAAGNPVSPCAKRKAAEARAAENAPETPAEGGQKAT